MKVKGEDRITFASTFFKNLHLSSFAPIRKGEGKVMGKVMGKVKPTAPTNPLHFNVLVHLMEER